MNQPNRKTECQEVPDGSYTTNEGIRDIIYTEESIYVHYIQKAIQFSFKSINSTLLLNRQIRTFVCKVKSKSVALTAKIVVLRVSSLGL